MAARVTQVAVEVLRTSSNAVHSTASTTITFTPSSSQIRNVVAAGSTLILVTPASSQSRNAVVSAETVISHYAFCSEVRNAVASGSHTITISPDASPNIVTTSSASDAVTLSGVATGVAIKNASAATTVTLTPTPSQVRDIPIAVSSAFTFHFLAADQFVAAGAMALTSVSLSCDASATRTIHAVSSATISAHGSATGTKDHNRASATTIRFTGSGRPIATFQCSAETSVSLSGRATEQQSSIGGNPMASQYVGYLGQYQLGQVLPLVLRAVGYQGRILTPDDYPVATLYADDGTSQTFVLPAIDRVNAIFSLPIPLGLTFSLGRYRVLHSYISAGERRARVDYFEIIPGGDPGGSVISIFALDRPESGYVLAQLSSGKLVQGRNPQI